MQTLKSTNRKRIDTGYAEALYSASRTQGKACMCGAGPQYLQRDIYGRPASQQTLTVNLDASCAQGTSFPAHRMIEVENYNRPYTHIYTTNSVRGYGGNSCGHSSSNSVRECSHRSSY